MFWSKAEFINKSLPQLSIANDRILPPMNIKKRNVSILLCQIINKDFNCSGFWCKTNGAASVVSPTCCAREANGETSIHINSSDGLRGSIANICSSRTAVGIAVRGFCRGHVIAVFGCGGDRDPFKRPIMGRIGAELADLSVVTSDNPRTEDPMAIIDAIVAGMQEGPHPHVVIENRVKAIEWALAHAEKDDVIVLCGKGHETYQEIGHEKRHLDEREVVASYLGRNV